MTAVLAGPWRFGFDDLPLSPNHMHILVPYMDKETGKPKARKVLTAEAGQ